MVIKGIKFVTNTKRVVWYLLVIAFAGVMLFPFYWAVICSFKSMAQIFERVSFIPDITKLNLNNYIELFQETLFVRWYGNTLLIAVSKMLLTLFFCSLAGYTFSKHDFPFKTILFWIILSSMMIPPFATIIPIFILFAKLRLMNTYWAVILPGSANAFGIFLMRQYILGIPSEMIDSARIDGCSEFKIYYKIILPTIKPVLGALGILTFLTAWNSLLFPLLFMQSEKMFTVSVGLASFIGEYDPQYGWLMAGSVLAVIPVIVMFLRMQKEFMSGLTLGAVKG